MTKKCLDYITLQRESYFNYARTFLLQVEEEILTLRQVLGAKVRRAAEIKRQMGITPFQEFKQDLQHGIKSIQDSDAYVYIDNVLLLSLLTEGIKSYRT